MAQRLAERKQWPELTERERAVLALLPKGLSNPDIARVLDIKLGTVKSHVASLFLKLGVVDRAEAVAVAVQRGMIRLEDDLTVRAGFRLFFWLLAVLGADAQEPLPEPIRDIAAIRALPRPEAAMALPVRVRGVVTYHSGVEHGGFIIQSGDRGIYANSPEITAADITAASGQPVPFGDLGLDVEIEGITGPGEFMPVVSARRIRVLGRAPMPDPCPRR